MKTKKPAGPRVNVVVTDEIIQQARPRDSRHCMIADAVRASVPEAKYISVDIATIRFTDQKKGLRYTYLTPRTAQGELVKFDQGVLPPAYSFQLRGAHVTRAGTRKSKRTERTELQKEAIKKNQKKGQRVSPLMAKQGFATHRGVHSDTVPDRIGGKTPPLQVDAETKIPFSRRRAFGLRGLTF